MSILLEITQLENGDIVLREADEDDETPAGNAAGGVVSSDPVGVSLQAKRREPLVRISFSDEVKDMLGNELVDVAEAMIDAATDFLGSETIEVEAPPAPVVH
jgi:hypothetical protein